MSVEPDKDDSLIDNVVDLASKKVIGAAAKGIEQAVDANITEKVEEKAQTTTMSVFYSPKLLGWLLLVFIIVVAGYAIVENNSRRGGRISQQSTSGSAVSPAPSSNPTQAEDPVEANEPDSTQNDSDRSCKVRNDDTAHASALSLDATDAIRVTEYKGKIAFYQKGCNLKAEVFIKQPMIDAEMASLEKEITNIVMDNLSSDVSHKVRIDFTYPLQ